MEKEEANIKLGESEYLVTGDSREAHKYKVLYEGKDVSGHVRGIIFVNPTYDEVSVSKTLKRGVEVFFQAVGIFILILLVLLALWLIYGGAMLAHDSANAIVALGGV